MTSIAFAFLPAEALPLIIALAGLGVVVGLLRPRTAFGIIGLFVLFLVLTPFIEAILVSLPWWAFALVLAGFVTWLVRTALTALLGREGAGHVLGVTFLAVVKLLVGIIALPFRAGGRLVMAALRSRTAIPKSGAGGNSGSRRVRIVVALILATQVPPAPVEAQAARATARAARSAFAARMRTALRRDALRDPTLAVKKLRLPMRVFRYTSVERAKQEAARGLRSGIHMTARARPGRPLSGRVAAKKYGLRRPPTARELIELPAGTPVRRGKVLGGRAGIGETTSPQPLPGTAVKKVIRVPR